MLPYSAENAYSACLTRWPAHRISTHQASKRIAHQSHMERQDMPRRTPLTRDPAHARLRGTKANENGEQSAIRRGAADSEDGQRSKRKTDSEAREHVRGTRARTSVAFMAYCSHKRHEISASNRTPNAWRTLRNNRDRVGNHSQTFCEADAGTAGGQPSTGFVPSTSQTG